MHEGLIIIMLIKYINKRELNREMRGKLKLILRVPHNNFEAITKNYQI